MNFKRLLCMSLAALSIFASSSIVGAQEAEDVATEEAVLAEDAELFAIKEVTSGVLIFECDTTAKTAKLIGLTDIAKGANIPATVKSGSIECKVTEIADGVGSGYTKLETVNFTNATNLTKIGENCFSYCPELYSVTFATKTGKITSIGNNCFYYCPKLNTVANIDKQTSFTEIGSSVFGLTPFMDSQTAEFVMFANVLVKYNGTKTSVKVPSDTVAIADAFFGKNITEIDLGDDLEIIGNNAFYGCKNLESISIPSSCTKIGDMAFAGCTSLKTVEYDGGLTSVGFCSFANCPELISFKNTSTKASKLTDIGECAFWNDRKLYYLDTGTIANVNVGSFWNCFGDGPEAKYYYRIPNTVETIAEGGYGNLWFSYVTVPESVEAFASTAFGSTSGATYVIVKGSVADEYFKDSGYSYVYYGDVTTDGIINAKDIKTIAGFIAQGINDLNYSFGQGVIADKDNDNDISIKDLNEIFRSIKKDYEASLSAE